MTTFGEPIYTYTRSDAIADGYLVDVTDTAARAGFRVPVTITRAAWLDCVEWSDADTERKAVPQTETGRLMDVLAMARVYMSIATRRNPDAERTRVQVSRIPREGTSTRAQTVTLLAAIGPDDDGAPCLTIGQPDDF